MTVKPAKFIFGGFAKATSEEMTTMPGKLSTNGSKVETRKRKRSEESGKKLQKNKNNIECLDTANSSSSNKQVTALVRGTLESQEDILQLEEAIVESQKNYNGIILLLECLQKFELPELAVTSAVSLCRIFVRLMARGKFLKQKKTSKAEATVSQWLKDRYKDYTKELCKLVQRNGDTGVQVTALTLLMRLIKEEGNYLRPEADRLFFPHNSMAKITEAILYVNPIEHEAVRDEFVEKYLNSWHDVKYSFLSAATVLAQGAQSKPNMPALRANLTSILLGMKNLPLKQKEYELSPFYVPDPLNEKSDQQKQPPTLSISGLRKQLQECWLAVMKLDIEKDQLKVVLEVMTQKIIPLFTQPTLLMDFLTDSYDAGGPLALLALNGLFQLIKSHNLDYPNFFPKLYALLDRNLMHVKYRSRFFRMLDTFLSSTHLPAALVASFIKRVSRLSLTAPPAAIVIVIPFIYNLLKRHPSCTFMVHRVGWDMVELRKKGMEDPFDEEEGDPLKTGALESSLWEIETLQSHYHPNVATLAKIISEQFTKHSYNMEDFLDHTYSTMIDSELSKPLKKEPVVEYEIPKRIFSIDPDVEENVDAYGNPQQGYLRALWEF